MPKKKHSIRQAQDKPIRPFGKTQGKKKTKQTISHNNFDTQVAERPLDPNRNVSDLMGDPSGLTGWTVGKASDTSAEPTEKQPGLKNMPGGVVEDEKSHQPTGIPKEAVSDKVYNHNVWQAMSQTAGKVSDERASEAEEFTSVSDMIRETGKEEPEKDTYDPQALRRESVGDDSPGSDAINTESAPYSHDENVGSEEVSGSETDPNSDSDALAEAQAMGTQLDEDSEHPKPLAVDEDIQKAEDWIREH